MSRLMAWLVLVLLTLGTPLVAHEGHAHKIMGVVSMIHENHLEVTDLKDQKSTFTIAAQTKVRRGRTALRLADIKVGERVVVTYLETKDKAGRVTTVVKQVQVGVTPSATSTPRASQG